MNPACINWCHDKTKETYCDDQCEIAHLKEQIKAHTGILRHVQRHIDTLRDEELGEMGNRYCHSLYKSIELHLKEKG